MQTTRKLGRAGARLSVIGLGCMGISEFYGPRDDVSWLRPSTAQSSSASSIPPTSMGPFTNEELVGKAIKGRRDQVIVATKFGIVREPNNPGPGVPNPRKERDHVIAASRQEPRASLRQEHH